MINGLKNENNNIDYIHYSEFHVLNIQVYISTIFLKEKQNTLLQVSIKHALILIDAILLYSSELIYFDDDIYL